MTFLKAPIALALLCLAPISAAAQPALAGKVTDGANALPNAVVMIKVGGNLLASARTLTDAEGNFGQFKPAAVEVGGGGDTLLVVKKAGYLPKTINYGGLSGNAGTVVLERDPLESRIDSVMALMNLAEKIAQMTQPELGQPSTYSPNVVNTPNKGTDYLYGSVLNGGGGYDSAFFGKVAPALNGWPAGRARIPTSYGKDAVHGNADLVGYTVFPHNIGLGAARDSALVRRIGEATAKQLWAARIDLNFSPAISVVRDVRWGRSYESYGETAELAVQMGAAMVRGLQGERWNAAWRVTATAKHFLGDGGTTGGKDRGNTAATDAELRAIHLPGYEAAVEQGVLSVMASFNQINGTHQHVDSVRLTGWLKTELGFDGYVISDWQGIANSTQPGYTSSTGYGPGAAGPTLTQDAVRNAINAGIDLAMEPGTHTNFMTYLTALVTSGSVSQDRINDAVRRILRAKFRAGRMDNFAGPAEFVGNAANKNSDAHRAAAREAVQKSQVLLKNENSALPLSKSAKVHVFGSHRDNIGLQCGGWTLGWQGVTSSTNFAGVGTSIYKGMQDAAGANVSASAAEADVVVYVTGERPYAEWQGDSSNLNFAPPAADMTNLANYRGQGKKIVTVFVAGRPRVVPQLLDASDAFLVAWLPGTEGGGVADVLFGDAAVTGKLPVTWPGATGAAQFPYGFGLRYGTTSIAVSVREFPAAKNESVGALHPLPAVTINDFTAGPNPVALRSGGVNFFWQGGGIKGGALNIYDAFGNFVKRINLGDNPASEPGRRVVGAWDFTDRKGRSVSEGGYIVKGAVAGRDGKNKKVSFVLGVR